MSAATVKTIVLPGYEIKVGDLQSSKYAYNLSLIHEGVSPVFMSVDNPDELDNWIAILQKYTKAEGTVRQKKISKLLPDEAPSKIVSQKVVAKVLVSEKKKGPVKADHNISGVKSLLEVSLEGLFIFYFSCFFVCMRVQ